jgi:ABC transporter substrate binding protein
MFTSVSDPVVQGFVPSLMRPGANITGFGLYEFSIAGKWLDLLKQLVPALKRVAVVFNPETSAPLTRKDLDQISTDVPIVALRARRGACKRTWARRSRRTAAGT